MPNKKKIEKGKDWGTPLDNPKQEKFCRLYASDEEFFGNGTQSYIEAFNPKRKGNWYRSAQSESCRLLTNDYILKRIDEILEISINNSFVDKRLGFWITQMAHPSTAMEGIKEYNRLREKINDKLRNENILRDLTDAEIDNLTTVALEELARRRAEDIIESRAERKKKSSK